MNELCAWKIIYAFCINTKEKKPAKIFQSNKIPTNLFNSIDIKMKIWKIYPLHTYMYSFFDFCFIAYIHRIWSWNEKQSIQVYIIQVQLQNLRTKLSFYSLCSNYGISCYLEAHQMRNDRIMVSKILKYTCYSSLFLSYIIFVAILWSWLRCVSFYLK